MFIMLKLNVIESLHLANVNSRSRSLYAIACPSVCLSVCLSSVTFVHPTQAIEIFGSVSMPWPSLTFG